MTDRWSNPSGGEGYDRFRVWPAGSDSYAHADLANNWDTLDGIIGIPSGSNWPPSTGVDGGIYKEVALLQDERTPIGTIVSWFRPSDSIAIPTNWHVCDGTVLTTGQHNFPGISGSVTLPDLRNRFILGADSTLTSGTPAANVGTAGIDTASGAPGQSTLGGSNQIIQTTAQMVSHNHVFTGNAPASHNHTFTGSTLAPHNHETPDISAANDHKGGGGDKALVDIGGITGATDFYETVGVVVSSTSAGTPTGTIGQTVGGTPSGTISSVGSGSPMDNRPHWIGLIFICKVLNATTI